MRYKVTIYHKKNQDKVRNIFIEETLKDAKHHARIAFVSGYPVKIDKIISKKKKKTARGIAGVSLKMPKFRF